MRLSKLIAKNFLGARDIHLDLEHQVQLFCGPNGAGKSSIRDAVALAMTADLGRVSLKKEAGQLVREGAKSSLCEIVTADGYTCSVSISNVGKITDNRISLKDDTVLPYVLDAQRFSQLGANERRTFLLGLMQVDTDPAAIKAQLLQHRHNPDKVNRVAPLLRSGFDAAHKEAKAKATEARGAWKAITGETYGSEKAKTWQAQVPEHDAAAVKAMAFEMKACDHALDQWLLEVGKLQGEEKRRGELRAKLPVLKDHAARIERIQTKLDKDSKELAEWEADVIKTKAAAGGVARVGLVHELAWAVDNLILHGDPLEDDGDDGRIKAALQAYEREFGKVIRSGDEAVDHGAQARLPNIIKSRDLMANAVANGKRDLLAAQQAAAEVEAIEKELAKAFDDKALADARAQVEAMKITRAELVKKLDAQSSLKKQAEAAEQKTKQAEAHAEDVTEWEDLAHALSPEGIPSQILANTLGPINERLAQSAVDTNWLKVEIDGDMALTGGGREYRLLSESEQWRVDAMLAEAIAHLSGMRLLMLDRFDVLDPASRGVLLGWLDVLADMGEIDTALLFGTLKAPPASETIPPTVAAHWVANGSITTPQTLKAAA